MAFLLPILPFFAYFGVVVFALVVLAAAFWPWVEPRLISFLTDIRERRTRPVLKVGKRGSR